MIQIEDFDVTAIREGDILLLRAKVPIHQEDFGRIKQFGDDAETCLGIKILCLDAGFDLMVLRKDAV